MNCATNQPGNLSADETTKLPDLLRQFVGGQTSPFLDSKTVKDVIEQAVHLLRTDIGLGFSQFNEVMLHLGYDRISHESFQYLVDGTLDYAGESIKTLDALCRGIERFRKLAMLHFGNVKFGFKQLSSDPEELRLRVTIPLEPRKFEGRHKPALDIEKIPADQTYYLGYLVNREIQEKLRKNPHDESALEQQRRRSEIVDKGVRNQDAYLCFDHMDVYIATSMRERHEYALVHKWTETIMSQVEISDLKVRLFDPTQAYCADRIDKGLAEALMLKRAFCTVYFAQESDTLGKDSELASTLAQGKPVIAYIPKGGSEYVEELEAILGQTQPELNKNEALLHQMRLFDATLAWTDSEVRSWLEKPSECDETVLKARLAEITKTQYNKRADLLKENHPLGIQVHLETGVANGVLVVRDLGDCARIIRRVLLNELEFSLEEKIVEEKSYLLMRESISQSVFRIMTGDQKLTNSFWNFYLN